MNTIKEVKQWHEAKMGNDFQGLIVNETGRNIAVTYDKSDAAFIVRAVNSYKELLWIAIAYRNHLKACAASEGEVATYHHINDILAKAEGK